MHFQVSGRLILTAAMFAAAFIAVTFIFVKKPHLVKRRNRIVRTAVIFCIAFVPGVLAATVCAKGVMDICTHVFGEGITASEEFAEEDEEEEEKRAV